MAGSLAAVADDGQATLYWQNPNDSAITKWQYRFKSRSASDERFGSYGAWTDIPCASPCSVRTLAFLRGHQPDQQHDLPPSKSAP